MLHLIFLARLLAYLLIYLFMIHTSIIYIVLFELYYILIYFFKSISFLSINDKVTELV